MNIHIHITTPCDHKSTSIHHNFSMISACISLFFPIKNSYQQPKISDVSIIFSWFSCKILMKSPCFAMFSPCFSRFVMMKSARKSPSVLLMGGISTAICWVWSRGAGAAETPGRDMSNTTCQICMLIRGVYLYNIHVYMTYLYV